MVAVIWLLLAVFGALACLYAGARIACYAEAPYIEWLKGQVEQFGERTSKLQRDLLAKEDRRDRLEAEIRELEARRDWLVRAVCRLENDRDVLVQEKTDA